MDVMSVRIDPATKARMAGFSDVNWAEVIREAVRERLDIEEELSRPLDRRRALKAARSMDKIRSKLPQGSFDSTKEVRRWRESRK